MNVLNVEFFNVFGKFWKVEDLKDVLEIVMESEKLVEMIYRKFVEECKKEEFKRVYFMLVDVERGYYEFLKKLVGGIVNGRF